MLVQVNVNDRVYQVPAQSTFEAVVNVLDFEMKDASILVRGLRGPDQPLKIVAKKIEQ